MNNFAKELSQHWRELEGNMARPMVPVPENSSYTVEALSHILIDWKKENQVEYICWASLKRLENYDFLTAAHGLGKNSGYSPATLEILELLLKNIEQTAKDWQTAPAQIYRHYFQSSEKAFLRMTDFLNVFNEKLELEQQIKLEPANSLQVSPGSMFKI